MTKLKPMTQKTLDGYIEKLNGDQAEYNNERTPKERKEELRPTLRDRDQNINYLQMWINGGCLTAKNGDLLLNPSKNGSGEISVKVDLALFE